MIEGTIDKIAFGGSGILRHEGLVIFVPFSARGDTAQVKLTQKKSSHAHGKIAVLNQPSPHRLEPRCPIYGKCGGCHFQHLNYAEQLYNKRLFVQESLLKIGKIALDVPAVVPASLQWGYRSHIKLKMINVENGFQAGFIECDHVTFIPVNNCQLLSGSEDNILGEIGDFLEKLSNLGVRRASLKVFKNENQKYFLAFSFSPKLPDNRHYIAKEAIEKISNLEGITMQAREKKETYGTICSKIQIENLYFQFSPFGFIQNHLEQSKQLYSFITVNLDRDHQISRVLDLYCGIGITSLLLAEKGIEVIGIESHEDTVRLARQNAEDNRLSQVTFVHAQVENALEGHLKKFKPDCILMNPPRTGLSSSILDEIIRSKTSQLIYISCMPPTLARDLKLLMQANYRILEIKVFDMFPQTTHVETVVKLSNEYTENNSKKIGF